MFARRRRSWHAACTCFVRELLRGGVKRIERGEPPGARRRGSSASLVYHAMRRIGASNESAVQQIRRRARRLPRKVQGIGGGIKPQQFDLKLISFGGAPSDCVARFRLTLPVGVRRAQSRPARTHRYSTAFRRTIVEVS
jgi:hypothetical protein